LNYLPGLFLCSQIIPRLVKKNNNTVGGIIQGSIIFAMVSRTEFRRTEE